MTPSLAQWTTPVQFLWKKCTKWKPRMCQRHHISSSKMLNRQTVQIFGMGGVNRSLTGTKLQPKLKLLLIFTKLPILQPTAQNTTFSTHFNNMKGRNKGVSKNLHMLYKTFWTKAFMTVYSTVFTILIGSASTQISTCNK